MDRRDFLKKASAGGLGLALSQPLSTVTKAADARPNILFIMVDQLRYPSVFPTGVTNVNQFLKQFMPHTHKLWKKGVKFTKHFGASSACTPSRGVIVTGLYSQQQWILQTLTNGPNTKVSIPPILDPVFPTYGKLLRQAGYKTPYIGKWHLSLEQTKHPLEVYGFDGMTKPDPTGANLQGAVGDHENGFLNDHDIAKQAADWLSTQTTSSPPWCLTVSFVNPHDHEFFWGGTEFQTFNNLFNAQTTYQPFNFYWTNNGTDYPPVVSWDDDVLKAPPSYGYPAVPPNWESAAQLQANKPAAHMLVRTFSEFVWGGASDDPGQTGFTITPYPSLDGYGIGVAPYSYWQRNLDSYTQTMNLVDKQIGKVLNAMPDDVASNTVIVFVSDHGDYVGSHGMLSNKAVTAYDECFHVPLIVVDPTGRFAGDIDTHRDGLTSSVDLLNLLVSLGHNGSQEWLTGAYGQMYGKRHNMIPMLKSASARGRPYILFATDELVQPTYNFNDARMHVTCMRTANEKLATYVDWRSFTTSPVPSSLQVEFYDYATSGGRAETDNTPDDPRVAAMLHRLRDNLVQNELQARLPGIYHFAQLRARDQYLKFAHLILNPPSGDDRPSIVKKWLGYGLDF
jgi:uncharacterized sulfatase